MAQQKTKTSEVIATLNAAIAGRSRLPEFDLKRLEREARNILAKVSELEGFTLLGAIASYRGDFDESRKWHKNAVRVAPYSSFANFNYATSLLSFGKFKEAVYYIDQAVRFDRDEGMDEVDGMNSYGKIYMAAGKLRKAVEYCPEREDIRSYLDRYAAADDDFDAYTDSMEAVITRHKLSMPFSAVNILKWDSSEVLHFDAMIEADPETVGELNWELAEELATRKIPAHLSGKVSARFSSNER